MPTPAVPSRTLRLRDIELVCDPADPLVMGVLNASPESFSDGDAALTGDTRSRAEELLEAGADLIDVGGESGVTGIDTIAIEEEIRRVVPTVEHLVDAGAVVSVDTWKAPVARAVLEAGAHLINDVSGLRDEAIAEICADHGAGLVVMHTRAEPKVKEFPDYPDVLADVISFLRERIDSALAKGLGTDQVVVDPGPDFAKTPAQTIEILRSLDRLDEFEAPILLAVSRKDFIGALTGRSPKARDAGTLAAIEAGIRRGASILRVHDVRATIDFLAVHAALEGRFEVADDLHLPIHLRREASAP